MYVYVVKFLFTGLLWSSIFGPYRSKLDLVIDSENGGVPRHQGQIADSMDEWEGSIADGLGLTPAEVAFIKMKYPNQLNLQT